MSDFSRNWKLTCNIPVTVEVIDDLEAMDIGVIQRYMQAEINKSYNQMLREVEGK